MEEKILEEKILIEGHFKKYTTPFLVTAIIFCCLGILYAIISITTELYWFLVATSVFEILAVLFFVIYKFIAPKNNPYELIITESRVTGKVKKHRIDLPVNQITSIGTLAFNGISVHTASGELGFLYLINQTEVFDCLSELIIKQHEQVNANTTQRSEGLAERLGKLKDLLDQGIITQEEFDAKKKQILGL